MYIKRHGIRDRYILPFCLGWRGIPVRHRWYEASISRHLRERQQHSQHHSQHHSQQPSQHHSQQRRRRRRLCKPLRTFILIFRDLHWLRLFLCIILLENMYFTSMPIRLLVDWRNMLFWCDPSNYPQWSIMDFVFHNIDLSLYKTFIRFLQIYTAIMSMKLSLPHLWQYRQYLIIIHSETPNFPVIYIPIYICSINWFAECNQSVQCEQECFRALSEIDRSADAL